MNKKRKCPGSKAKENVGQKDFFFISILRAFVSSEVSKETVVVCMLTGG